MTRSLAEYRRDLGFHLSRRLNHPFVKPDWVSYMATLRCNLTCTMCRTCYDNPVEMTREETFSLIDQVAEWGVNIFNVLGGEPFMRKDILEILAHSHHRGLVTSVTTNGTLINERRARALAPLNMVHFNVSLDGLADTNDAIRGKGVFDKACQFIARISELDREEAARRDELGLPWWPRQVTLNTLAHAQNLHQLIPLFEQIRDLGGTGVQVLALFEHGPESKDSPMWIGPDELPRFDAAIDGILRWFEDEAGDFRLVNPPEDLQNFKRYYRGQLRPLDAPCYNGFKELYVNPDGKVLMCDSKLDFLADSAGDARHTPVREIWTSRKARAMRRKVIDCQHACTQDCYRRRESDSVRVIARGASRVLMDDLKRRRAERREREDS